MAGEYRIAELVPLEPAAVRGSYKFWFDELMRNPRALHEHTPHIKVISAGGRTVVRNGNNRVKAAKDAGLVEVPAELESEPSIEKLAVDIIPLREQKGQMGFENFPVVADVETRKYMNRQEIDESGANVLYAALKANLAELETQRVKSRTDRSTPTR